jgi:Mrp family chromosome partitioning ATPase
MAMNLSVLLSAAPRRGVVVMSPRRRDGRTSVATRLASATAQRGPTLLVASPGRADAEYSSLIRWSRNGDMDEVPEHLRHATATTEHKGLWLVAPQPLSLMRSPSALASFVADATDAGFTTIFDSPPATLASCAFELAHEVGQALYVVRDVGDLEVHRRIYEQLHRLDVKVIGLVVNER